MYDILDKLLESPEVKAGSFEEIKQSKQWHQDTDMSTLYKHPSGYEAQTDGGNILNWLYTKNHVNIYVFCKNKNHPDVTMRFFLDLYITFRNSHVTKVQHYNPDMLESHASKLSDFHQKIFLKFAL